MKRPFARNWILYTALVVSLLSAGCACVPEMNQAPDDNHLMSTETVVPAKAAN